MAKEKKIVELFKRGLKPVDIAAQVGTSRQNVYQILKSRDLIPERSPYSNPNYDPVFAKKKNEIGFEKIKAQNFECYYCGRTLAPFGTKGKHGSTHLDHFIPRHLGGSNDPVNLVVSCHSCNSLKGSRQVTDAKRGLLQAKIGWPQFSSKQLEWLKAVGFDLLPFESARLHFEIMGWRDDLS